MEMIRSTYSSTVVLLLLIISSSLLITVPSATALGFNCNSTAATCSALIDYVSPTNKTLASIAQLFGVSFISLFGANSFPLSTSPVQTVEPNQTIKIPFQCSCAQGIGISNKVPIYTVKKGNYLIYIANQLYSGLVTYQEIATVNDISNPNLIFPNQKLWIPLPCSCDEVDGDQVVHYGHVVSNRSSVGQIAKEYGTTQGSLLKLNGLAHQNQLRAGQLIDVPLRACKSMVGNDSLDYPFLVPNGTKVLTANNCVQCTCESSKNWTLHCEPSQGVKPSNWTSCPSMQCQGGLLLGNTMSPCTTCAYAGYSNQSILTTLSKTCSIDVARKENQEDLGRMLAIAISSGTGIGIMVMLIVLYCCWRGKSSLDNKNKDIDVESFLENNGSLVPKRYSYLDIKNITDSFKEKLGEGGYGGVYKGKLLDGRFVAVKILNESKGNGEEFINEVASISKTSHVNIVALLGYCFEGIRRALVYEFMPNGSLDKFIYDKESSTTHPRLGWEALFNIATGIGRGLEYLHRGCNTRILHFDIKPHNILLDQDFCPKISDFGLAKLYPRKQNSIISMRDTRGTVGYIAPEVFFRNFGRVSHKSDVFSYGMMVLEMVGGRKNMNVSADHTSEVYFPHWIYKHFQQDQELVLEGLTSTLEEEIAKKMTLVGLWCIQTDPSNRPSMSKVVEMLEGSITSLQIPPKPYLCSPPRSPSDCSGTTAFTTALENSVIT